MNAQREESAEEGIAERKGDVRWWFACLCYRLKRKAAIL